MLKLTQDETDLSKNEIDILTGALLLQDKLVSDAMTPLLDCFMLSLEAVLDFNTICYIRTQEYSRIPIYDGERSNIRYILLVKDLLFVDPDDEKPMHEICSLYSKPFITVDKGKTLYKLMEEFKSGNMGHLAVLKDEDGVSNTVIVTLEDIIEEILQSEIVDEDDLVTNKSKRKRSKTENPIKQEVEMVLGRFLI